MGPMVVVKVGGSLFDFPDLRSRLKRWLEAQSDARLVLVPGGGAMADAVRDYHRVHGLDEERAHWLAIRTLGINAHFLAWLVGNGVVVEEAEDCTAAWEAGRLPVLDLFAFARADEHRPGRLPYSWRVTSDSLAARAAVALGARQLVLLKSVTIPEGTGWEQAAAQGQVDPAFPEVLRDAQGLEAQAINLREGH